MRIQLLTWVLTMLTMSAGAQIAGLEKPNVIFIVVDDLNDYVGFLDGHPQTLTPHLDKLANRGTAFTNAHCNIPQCTPSRMSMMSGKRGDYPDIHLGNEFDIVDFRANFDSLTVYTLPEILKDSGGYYTWTANKIYHPRNQITGTADIDYDSISTDPCERGKSWNQIIDLTRGGRTPKPDPAEQFGLLGLEWGAFADSLEDNHIDVRGVDSALQFLQDYFRRPSDFCDKPFFMALGLTKPHHPLFFPERLTPEFYNTNISQFPYELPYNAPFNLDPPNGVVMPPQPPAGNWTDYDSLPYIGKIMATDYGGYLHDQFVFYGNNLSPLPGIAPGLDSAQRRDAAMEAHRANSILAYLAMVRFMDDQVGRLITTLEGRPEVYHNTVIVLVSDHGFSLGEKKHWKKVALWESALRVPMIIADPRRTSARECSKPVSLVDLFPTILDLTATPHPDMSDGSEYLDGESLVPLLDNPDAFRNQPAVASLRLPAGYPDGGCFPHYSVRSDRYHYIRYTQNAAIDSANFCNPDSTLYQEELYEIGINREVDPNEWNNLAADPSYRSIMDELAQWIPGGPLANENGGVAEIMHDTLPCILDPADSSYFWVDIRDENGLSLDPGAFNIYWYSEIFYDTIYGSGFYYDALNIDGSSIADFDRMDLRVVAVDTATGVLYTDRESYHSKALLVPNASYDATVDGTTVSIDNYLVTGWIHSQDWAFGDGYINNDPVPAPHKYTLPGTYQIQQNLHYGSDERNLCLKKIKRIVEIDTAAFDSICPRVDHVELDWATANRARLEWRDVYNALEFRLRFREQVGPGNWKQTEAPAIDVALSNLKSNTNYEFQVQSICSVDGSDTSAFSPKTRFLTKSCDPPRAVSIEDVTANSAMIRWIPSQGEPVGAELIYRAASGGGLVFNSILDTDSLYITGLDAGTEYFFKMRSVCASNDGTLNIEGRLSQVYGFTTLDTAGVRIHKPLEIDLFPNPTSDVFELRRTGKLSDQMLMVTDASGRRMGTYRWNAGEISLRIDASEWTDGIYWISGPEMAPQQVAVIR